jgi:hypothetical protein
MQVISGQGVASATRDESKRWGRQFCSTHRRSRSAFECHLMSIDTSTVPRVRHQIGHLGDTHDRVLAVMIGLMFELIGHQNRWLIWTTTAAVPQARHEHRRSAQTLGL